MPSCHYYLCATSSNKTVHEMGRFINRFLRFAITILPRQSEGVCYLQTLWETIMTLELGFQRQLPWVYLPKLTWFVLVTLFQCPRETHLKEPLQPHLEILGHVIDSYGIPPPLTFEYSTATYEVLYDCLRANRSITSDKL